MGGGGGGGGREEGGHRPGGEGGGRGRGRGSGRGRPPQYKTRSSPGQSRSGRPDSRMPWRAGEAAVLAVAGEAAVLADAVAAALVGCSRLGRCTSAVALGGISTSSCNLDAVGRVG